MTIRKRLVLSYIAMLVVPFVLFFMTSGIVVYLTGASFDGDDFGAAPVRPPSPWRGIGRLSGGQIRSLSRTIASDPSFFKYPEKMDSLLKELSWAGTLAVTQDGRIVYSSSDTREEYLRSALGDGPTAGSGVKTMIEHRVRLLYSWVFSVPGESPATIHFFLNYLQSFKAFFFPGLLVFSLGALILAGTNGALTYVVSRSIIRPLSRLESMALRIRDGDLSEPDPPRRDPAARRKPDEFDAAFKAFGEMRLRLKGSLERQAEQEANRRELIAAISHDLRTPLSAVKGYAEGLRDGVAATEEKRQAYLETLLSKTRELDRLIEDLFLFSRLELGDFPYEMRKLELFPYVSGLVAELAPDFPALRIALAPSDIAYPVTIDPLRMRRVVTNIVQNAAAYSGGPDARLEISLAEEGSGVTVRFADNGPGLDDGDLELVFERFRRLDPARGNGGAGLGLSIAKLIVEAHGGRIWAEKVSGRGACFAISLPLAAR